MSVLLSGLLLGVGYLLSVVLVEKATVVERVACTLLFAMAAVPFVAINVSLICGFYITKGLTLLLGGLLFGGSLWFVLAKRSNAVTVDKSELLALPGALLVGLASFFHYTNSEFLLSLASYVQSREAKCFYMQTFKFVGELNTGISGVEIRSMYEVISTPGNALFTAGLMPALGVHSFHCLYVGFQVLLFLFAFLLARFLFEKTWLALLVGLFAALNPYSLRVEVLDRNAMAYALSAALLYLVVAHRERHLLHGLLYGIAGGVGLRFLPLTLMIPVGIFYISGRVSVRGYATFAVGAVLTFAFNVPHLFYHGFHSLGESVPFHELLFSALTTGNRTPLLPFPNAVHYVLGALSSLGLVCGGLLVFGAGVALRRDWKTALALCFAPLATLLVLAAQRDWIEADKGRILLWSFLPFVLLPGFAVSYITSSRPATQRSSQRVKGLVGLVVAIAVVFGVSELLRGVVGSADDGFYARKPIYQTEHRLYGDHLREHYAPVGLLPDYHHLFLKKDPVRKHLEERVVSWMLFSRAGKVPWVEEELPPAEQVLPEPLSWLSSSSQSDEYVNLAVDLDLLLVAPHEAVTVVDDPRRVFVNLEDTSRLFDVYYKEVSVSWQQEKLTITVLPLKPERQVLGELHIELNAFIAINQDEYGLRLINTIDHVVVPGKNVQGLATAMKALPQRDELSSVVLRVPVDMRILFRNWIVNAVEGAPYRIDCWVIEPGTQTREAGSHGGGRTVEFFFQEPESYL